MKRLLWIQLYVLLLISVAVADGKTYSWDFSGCEIKDIVFAVSLDTGISIVCDDTVSGNADFKFSGRDFEVAFDAFLKGNRLYVEKYEALWMVSKFKISKEEELLSMDVCDLTPAEILEKLSCFVDNVITFETLPVFKMSVHFKNLSESDLMNNLAKRFGNYVVQKSDSGFHFCRVIETKKLEASDGFVNLTSENGFITLDIKNSGFVDVIEKVFTSEVGNKRNFCFITNCDFKVMRTSFEAKDFDCVLERFCKQSGVEVFVKDNIYYFFENKNSKDELLFGERNWICYNLKFSSSQEFLPLALKKIGTFEYYPIPDSNSFYAKVNPQEEESLALLVEEIDVKKEVFVVNLKYIRPEELLQHLPPCVDKANLFMADDNSCLYFKGTENAYLDFCEQIKICDCPKTRITYDLLIIQYDETFQNSWNTNFNVNTLNQGDRNVVNGQLGSVLGLNINIVSAFGLTFASSLQGSLEENKSSVYADTTLHGISGKSITFTNSSTYRYRDNNLDPDTGKPIYSGVTREIVSGINIQVTPWVSGDGMITTNVTASISRQGTDTSASTGNPPPTTEKIITTEVCSKSGEPVVLSGLIQNSLSEDSKGMPVIGRLPLFRKLLNSNEKHKEKSQMVIFLVPRIEMESVLDEEKTEKNCTKIAELISLLEA